MLGPAAHRREDTTHTTLQTMCTARAWPQKCWKSCADGSYIVALRFGDHGTKEMLGVVAQKIDKFQTLRNNSKKHATTCNRVCKRTQHVASNNAGSCWPRMLRPFSRGLSVVQWNPTKPPPVNITTLFWVSFLESTVKKQARKGVWAQRFYSTTWQELLISAVGTFSSIYAETIWFFWAYNIIIELAKLEFYFLCCAVRFSISTWS